MTDHPDLIDTMQATMRRIARILIRGAHAPTQPVNTGSEVDSRINDILRECSDNATPEELDGAVARVITTLIEDGQVAP